MNRGPRRSERRANRDDQRPVGRHSMSSFLYSVCFSAPHTPRFLWSTFLSPFVCFVFVFVLACVHSSKSFLPAFHLLAKLDVCILPLARVVRPLHSTRCRRVLLVSSFTHSLCTLFASQSLRGSSAIAIRRPCLSHRGSFRCTSSSYLLQICDLCSPVNGSLPYRMTLDLY